jgi:hypothetical protein
LALCPGPLNLKGTSHLVLEIEAIPRTATDEVLEGPRAERASVLHRGGAC